MTDSSRIRRRSALAAAAATLTLLAAGALLGAAPATAADDCAKQVIADWYDNGRVDQLYELQCYRDAVKALPVDVRDYSSAKDDILRALLLAQQGKTGDGGGSSGGSGGGTGTGGAGGGTGGGTSGGGTGGSGSGGGSGGGTPTTPGGSQVDTAGPSSIPVPLLVLAGLATLLLALGAAGYLTRRRAAQRDEPSAPA